MKQDETADRKKDNLTELEKSRRGEVSGTMYREEIYQNRKTNLYQDAYRTTRGEKQPRGDIGRIYKRENRKKKKTRGRLFTRLTS